MATHFLLEAPIGLVPVLIFLGVLFYFDSYRLTTPGEVVQTLGGGVLIGVAAYFLNGFLLSLTNLAFPTYSHFIAPFIEEGLKAAALIWLFARNRIGFMIDAAILGFAVGTGFAVFENIYYLYIFQDADVGVWIIRGFGTALMHGGATAIFGVLSQSFMEKRGGLKPLYFLPSLVAAIAVHMLYNQLSSAPLLAAVAVLIGLPPLFLLIFTKSEYAVHQWLVDDYKSHQQLLDDIDNGQFSHSEAGRFMVALTNNFDPAVVSDMFDYLKLHTQVVLRAEQLTLAREKNENAVPQPGDREDLLRLHLLEKRIGPVAMMALWPHLHFSRRELWRIHELYNQAHLRD